MKIFTLLTLSLSAVAIAQPVINNIVPTSAAAGPGQTITMQGFGLAPANNPVLTFQPLSGGAAPTCFTSSSFTDNELYFNLNVSTPTVPCLVPSGSYFVTVTTAQGTSAPFPFTVTDTVGVPLVKTILRNVGGFPQVVTQARGADQIIVYGDGISGVGAKVVFSQGARRIVVAALGAYSATLGPAAIVSVPLGFNPGTVLVGLEAHIGTNHNIPSNSLKIQIIP